MKRTFKKHLTALLILSMLMPSAAFADSGVESGNGSPGSPSAISVSDVKGHWAERQFDSWIQKGLIQGYGNGTYKPNQEITRAELITMINRVFNFTDVRDISFSDVNAEDSFYPEIKKAVAAGYLKGYENGTVRPKNPITRQEAAVMLAQVFELSPNPEGGSQLQDLAALPAWSRAAVLTLVHEGYVKGYDDQTFKANNRITRAEALAMVSNIAGEIITEPGTYTGISARNVTINRPGVILKDAKITGDLRLTKGVAAGEITLDNVTVSGRVIVNGGGQNGVTLTIAGADIHQLVMNTNGGKINLTSGTIGELVLNGETAIHVDEGGTINKVTIHVDKPITLTGKGKVHSEDSRLKREGNEAVVPPSKPSNPGSSSSSGSGSGSGSGSTPTPNPDQDIRFTNVSVHDPSVIKDGNTYYVFGSHIEAAKSTDLMNWTRFTNGYETPGNVLFGDLSQNLAGSFAWAGENDADSKGGYAVWAPDVYWNDEYVNEDGTTGAYMMYYSASSTYIRSAIGYAVSKNIEGPYKYVDTIIYSGFTENEAYDANSTVNKQWANTNIKRLIDDGALSGPNPSWFKNDGAYNNSGYPNAIDSTLFTDKDGKLWMTYGSWSGGIFVLELDPKTGKAIYPGKDGKTADGRMIDRYFGTKIAGGYTKSGEGPFILYDEESGTYFLTVTYGGLASDGGYNMRLFRSASPDGPYVDAAGQNAVLPGGDAANTNYGVKMIGNFLFERQIGDPGTGIGYGYVSPGHNSLYFDEKTGQKLLFFHTRFPQRGEAHEVRVHQLINNKDGWPVVAPLRYTGEKIKAVSEKELAGDYKFVNHGLAYSGDITTSVNIQLNADHTVSGGVTGTWQLEDDYFASVTIEGVTYDGVFIRQWDETAGKNTMTFAAISAAGETVWGIKQADKSDKQIVEDVRKALTLGDTSNVMSDLELPVKGARNASIAWETSDPAVVSNTGEVYPPEAGEESLTAVLTATITKGAATATKQFTIVVVPVDTEYGLTAQYAFENNLDDSYGLFDEGTITGDRIDNTGGTISYADGVVGKAAVFDGSSGIKLPDGLISSEHYSVTMWVYAEQHSQFTTTFFGGSENSWISLVPQSWDNNTMLWSGSKVYYDASTGSRIRAKQWHHIAFTVDGDAVKVYVNGVLKYSGTGFPDVFSAGGGSFGLGVNWWDIPFKGMIDELRIYNLPVTEEVIAKLAGDVPPASGETAAQLTAKFSFENNLTDTGGSFGAGTVTGSKIGSAGGTMTYEAGVQGQAAVFDGASGVLLPKGLISGDSYSVTMWVYADQLTSYTPAFFGAQTDSSWISFLPGGFGDDKSILWSGTKWYDAITNEVTPLHDWTHFAFTVNGDQVTVYVNGVEKFKGTGFPDIFLDRNGTFALGVNWWDIPFKGKMDELHVYKGVLTRDQVSDLAVK